MSPYLRHLSSLASSIVSLLHKKEETYGNAWLKRGGIGAFFVSSRKWDRIENILQKHNYDIFAAFAADKGRKDEETFTDTVDDLIGYLLMWRAEAVERGLLVEDKSRTDLQILSDLAKSAQSKGATTSPAPTRIGEPRGYDPRTEIIEKPTHPWEDPILTKEEAKSLYFHHLSKNCNLPQEFVAELYEDFVVNKLAPEKVAASHGISHAVSVRVLNDILSFGELKAIRP
jgi:hypothetical protein